LPGVQAAALTGAIPGDDGGDHRALAVADRTVGAGDELMVTLVPESDGFPEALGLSVKSGRWFTAAEAQDSGAAVAVVGEGLARRLWPDGALGRRIRALPDSAWLTVVGVVPDLQWEEFGEDGVTDRLQVHVPFGRAAWRSVALMVRAADNPDALLEPVRRAALAVHADVPVFDVMTMAQDRQATTASQASWLFLFGALGVQALVMTAIGLYGLLAFGVAQRRREIGVRVALGARPSTVVNLVVRRALALTAGGLAAGLAGAWIVARALQSQLWGVHGSMLPIAVAAGTLLLVSLVAATLPARRAAHVDPMEALRNE
jgi:putative ABC transport system permease protein